MKRLVTMGLPAGALAIAVLVLASSLWRAEPASEFHERVRRADHPALLAECRLLMQTMSNGVPSVISRLDADFTNRVPGAIRGLDPQYLIVETNIVTIAVSHIPRVFVLGFAPGAPPYGDQPLIAGLWLSHDPVGESKVLEPKE